MTNAANRPKDARFDYRTGLRPFQFKRQGSTSKDANHQNQRSHKRVTSAQLLPSASQNAQRRVMGEKTAALLLEHQSKTL